MLPVSSFTTFTAPWKERTLSSESASAGRVARSAAGSLSSERDTMRSESTSTLRRGKVFQNVSSTRET